MKRHGIFDLSEFTASNYISLEEYELEKRNIKRDSLYKRVNYNTQIMLYPKDKDTFLINDLIEKYTKKYSDNALLVFAQEAKDEKLTVCIIDTANPYQNESTLLISELDVETYPNDKQKIDDILSYYELEEERPLKLFYSFDGKGDGSAEDIKNSYFSDFDVFTKAKDLSSFMPNPVYSRNSLNKLILGVLSIAFIPMYLAYSNGAELSQAYNKKMKDLSVVEANKLYKAKRALKDSKNSYYYRERQKIQNIKFKKVAQ